MRLTVSSLLLLGDKVTSAMIPTLAQRAEYLKHFLDGLGLVVFGLLFHEVLVRGLQLELPAFYLVYDRVDCAA